MAVNDQNTYSIEKTTIERTTDSSGWVAALIILILAVVGGIWLWSQYQTANVQNTTQNSSAKNPGGSANINEVLQTLGGGTSTGNAGY